MSATTFDNYDRVTTVLAPFSGLSQIPQDILKRAAERGSHVHENINAIFHGLAQLHEGLEGYMQSFNQWLEGKKHANFEFPNRFFCEDLMLTGECDAIYPNGEGYTLIDFKTSSKESQTWRYQGAAYAGILTVKKIHVTRVEFVRLDKNGKAPVVHDYTEERFSDFAEFLTLLEVYRKWFKGSPNTEYLDHL